MLSRQVARAYAAMELSIFRPQHRNEKMWLATKWLTNWADTNGRHFADDIFKHIFLNENLWISHKILMNFVPIIRIDIGSDNGLAWYRQSDNILYETMFVSLLTHICVTRYQWVKHNIMFLSGFNRKRTTSYRMVLWHRMTEVQMVQVIKRTAEVTIAGNRSLVGWHTCVNIKLLPATINKNKYSTLMLYCVRYIVAEKSIIVFVTSCHM